MYASVIIEYKVKKLPWKPKHFESYYLPYLSAQSMITKVTWEDNWQDELVYKRGLVCKTREEAIALAKRILGVINSEKS